jgi:hypothetical protein
VTLKSCCELHTRSVGSEGFIYRASSTELMLSCACLQGCGSCFMPYLAAAAAHAAHGRVKSPDKFACIQTAASCTQRCGGCTELVPSCAFACK